MSSPSTRVSEPANPDRVFTLSQLAEYSGVNLTKPIYLGCRGVVYDVTAGEGFYGPGGPYGAFAGKDASRGLAKMEIAYKGADISDLSASEKQSLNEWADKYDTKYPIVGKIVDESEPNSGPAPAEGWKKN
jgi:membrane-associated progesterone receptor component